MLTSSTAKSVSYRKDKSLYAKYCASPTAIGTHVYIDNPKILLGYEIYM